jgi:integrase
MFGTGGRTGEVFALTTCYPEKVHINRQMDKEGRIRQTKNAKATPAHDAVIIPELKQYVTEWCAVPMVERRALRCLKWVDIFHRWFGVGPHDLRHSYAKRLCEKGFYLPEVASNLGTSERVAKLHYAGWLQTDPQISALARRLRGE